MVSTNDTAMPPMMARANGAYASLPVPSFIAIGVRPTMVAGGVTNIWWTLDLVTTEGNDHGEADGFKPSCGEV